MIDKLVIVLNVITTAGIFLYWLLYWTKVFSIKEIVPGYRSWFKSFLIPDLWIATTSFLTTFFLLQKSEMVSIFGLVTGSSLIFLGLYALSYGITTGLIFRRTAENLVEILIKLYCLIAGTFFIIYFS